MVPTTPKARFLANVEVLDLLDRLDTENRFATPTEQATLASWSSWGAIPEVFDAEHDAWSAEREELRGRLNAQEWDAARVTTLNAHYTEPRIAQAMWSALQGAGFTEGTVLEPGCGAGTFIGQAPESATMLGVELDPVTARIASHLYPQAVIHGFGYEKLALPEGLASAAIGNVPFGNFRVHDPRYNASKLNIHNHFIAKSLRLVAPGGYVSIITSSYTMDASTSKARREIAKYGDLVSATRLPSNAFRAVAGTDVLTDVLVFRRREDGATADEKQISAWAETGTLSVEGQDITTNQWFIENPSAILGTVSTTSNQFGQQVMRVSATGDTAEELEARQRTDFTLAAQNGLGYTPQTNAVPETALQGLLAPGLRTAPAHVDAVIGHVRLTESRSGLESFGVDGLWEPIKLPLKNQKAKIREYGDLIGLKETARAVIDAQRNGGLDAEERKALRASLLNQYGAYTATFGPINRFTLIPGRKLPQKKIDAIIKVSEAAWRRDLDLDLSPAERRDMPIPVATRQEWAEEAARVDDIRLQEHTIALRADPDFGLLMSVERFDEETGEARPSALCVEDILGSTHTSRSAENPADALAICLDESRSVDLGRIGELLELDEVGARAALGDLVFEDPRTGELVPAVHYLSGDVIEKLDAAHDAVSAGRLDFEANISALEKVKRRKVEHFEINTKPGGYWVEPQDYADFCHETFRATVEVGRNPLTDTWALSGPTVSKFAADVQFAYGVGKKKSPVWVLEQVMNNRSLKIMKKIDVETSSGLVEKQVEDQRATAVARAKATALTETFAKWLYQDDSRRERVVDRYNRMFNSYVAPNYTSLAEHMSLPGVAEKFVPHHYQREAVARIVNEPTVLLDHVVGAGKTGTMVMGAMELRRTGIARKPWVVVPNHLVDQIGREFKDWYPASSVLVVPTGADEPTRRQHVAASATGDWDAVIVPFSTFEKISVDPVKTRAWLEEEISGLRAELEAKKASGEKSRVTVKSIEAAIKKLEVRHEAITSNKDAGLTFEDTGCDYLFVDEAHGFKNLRRTSDFQELAHTGSNRASDLDYKLRSLREGKLDQAHAEGRDTHGYLPAVATFATGTPVANSLAELWVMQHYLRPDLLEKASLRTVDAWGNQFTKSATKIELSPSGSEYKARERLAKFVNVPELLAMTNQFTSAVTTDDITAKLPSLVDGKRTPMVREASEHVLEYVQELAERAENLPSDPSEDNLLKITNDGRSVALDPRLAGLDADPDGGRVSQVAEQVLRIHRNTTDTRFENSFGETEPLAGGLQLIFSDRAIPNNTGRFSIYDAITDELVAGGIDRDQIAFIHDASNDAEKAALFERCRNGKVRVLFGSTERMGTGTNVQKRAVALHHVDIPWRPADLEQREGRVIRQGNQNDEVEILNYVTEGTFDVYMWQTVTRKAEFIAQVKHANVDARSVDDISSDFALMAAEMKALATGNPELIEYSQLTSDIHTLEVLERAHWDSMAMLKIERQGVAQELTVTKEVASSINDSLEKIKDTSAEKFAMTIGGVATRERDTAARALAQAVGTLVAKAQMSQDFEAKALAQVGGFTVTARWAGRSLVVGLEGVRGVTKSWTEELWSRTGAGHGLVTRLENLVSALPEDHARALEKIVERTERLAQIDSMNLDQPYGEAALLKEKREAAAALREKLGMPEIANADEFELDTEPMVLAEELSRFTDPVNIRAHQLRIGDVIELRGNKKGTFEVLETSTVGGRYLLLPTDAGDDVEPTDMGHHIMDRIELVSRRVNALSLLEKAAHELPATDAIAESLDAVAVGETITVRGKIGKVESEIRGVLKKSKHVSVPYGHSSAELSIETDAGLQKIVVSTFKPGIVRHGVLDPVEEARKAQAQAAAEQERRSHVTSYTLLPGDVLLEDAPGLGLRGDVVLTPFREPSWGKPVFHDPATGTGRKMEGKYEPRKVNTLTGRELTAAEMAALFPRADSSAFTVAELRRGDRVLSTDVNPKATIAEEVHILDIGYGPRHTIEYRPVAAPWESSTSVNRMDSQVVSLLGRRYGALDDFEFASLQNPGQVEIAGLSDINNHIVGSWVEFKGYTKRPANRWSREDQDTAFVRGRLLETTTDSVRGTQGNVDYFTLDVDVDGQRITVGSYDRNKPVTVFMSTDTPNPSDFRGMELPALLSAQKMVDELFATAEPPVIIHDAEPVSAAAEPVAPVEIAAPAPEEDVSAALAEDTAADDTAVQVEHSIVGTLISNTERVSEVSGRLKELGFKWSKNLGSWYLPRNWKQESRDERVRSLVNWMEAENVEFHALSEGSTELIHPVLARPGDLIRVNLLDQPPVGIDPHALGDAWIPSLPATVLANTGGYPSIAVTIGEQSWHMVLSPSTESLLEKVTEDEAVQFSEQHEHGPLVHSLNHVVGVDPVEVPVGSRITLQGKTYQNLESLQEQPWSTYNNVVLLSKHDKADDRSQLWTVEDRGEQRVILVREVAGSSQIGDHVRIHAPGTGKALAVAAEVPRVFSVPLGEVSPGWNLTVQGIDPSTHGKFEPSTMVRTGAFIGLEQAPNDHFRLSLMVAGQPEYLLVPEAELERYVLVEVPLDFQEQTPAEVVESLIEDPVFAASVPGIDRERDRRIMIAAQLLPGSVLVADNGARAVVLSNERVSQENALIHLANPDAPEQTKKLTVNGWKKFNVEPLPLHLGVQTQMTARALGPENHFEQVWWNESSKEAGYILGFADTDERGKTQLLVHDGKGKAFKVTLDPSMKVHTRNSAPELDDVEAEEHQALSDAALSTEEFNTASM